LIVKNYHEHSTRTHECVQHSPTQSFTVLVQCQAIPGDGERVHSAACASGDEIRFGSVVKVVLWSRGGAHLTKPGWSKPHTHSNPNNLALFRHKITLYRFNQGGSYYCRVGSNGSRGLSPLPPHFNHWMANGSTQQPVPPLWTTTGRWNMGRYSSPPDGSSYQDWLLCVESCQCG